MNCIRVCQQYMCVDIKYLALASPSPSSYRSDFQISQLIQDHWQPNHWQDRSITGSTNGAPTQGYGLGYILEGIFCQWLLGSLGFSFKVCPNPQRPLHHPRLTFFFSA